MAGDETGRKDLQHWNGFHACITVDCGIKKKKRMAKMCKSYLETFHIC